MKRIESSPKACRHMPFGLTLGSLGLLLCTALAPCVRAQIDTGRILGMVDDQSGAVVPGATVRLVNEGTGLALAATTGATGYYVFAALKVGTYRVEIEATGFTKFVQSGVPVHVQEDVVVNATLRPGALTQIIEVKGAPPLLQTQSASLGQRIGSDVVNDLPLNGRNWTQLAEIGAGVTYSQPDASNRPYFSANGHPLEQNDYRLNGINNNDEAWTLPEPYVALPPPDAIAEFKVQTNNYSAEFGHSGGAVINATVKSGTNQIHGDAWEYVRNDKLDAAQFFENTSGLKKGAYRQNQFGFTFGGPAFIPHLYSGKDKTFFFFGYQGTRIRQAQTTVDTVPTNAMRQSGYTNLQELITFQSGTRTDNLGRTFPLGTVFDPATTRGVTAGQVDPLTSLIATTSGYVRDPFYQGSLVGLTNFTSPAIESQLNLLPAGRLNPNAIKLLNLYPVPILPGLFNDYTYDAPIRDDTNGVDLRVDENFSERDQMFVFGSWWHRPLYIPSSYPGLAGDAGNWAGLRDNRADALGVSETHFFSPTMINEARLGFSRSPVSVVGSYGSKMGIPEQFGIQGIPQVANNGGLPYISIQGLTTMGTSGWLPTIASSATWDLTENLTKVFGGHTFKGGFQGDYIMTPVLQPAWSHGGFDFGGAYTEVPNTSGGGTGMAQLLLEPASASVPGGADAVFASNFAADFYTRDYYGAYFQDDWKVTPKLTLNLGLRWDHFTPYSEKYGAQSNFIPGAPGNGAEFLIPSPRCIDPRSPSFAALAARDGIDVTCSRSLALGNVQNANFAPRVGFAYHLASKLALRAGYGIFYGALGSLGYGNTLGNSYPFLFNFFYFSPDAAHPIAYPNGSIGTLETGLSGINLSAAAVNAQFLSLTGRQFDFLTPYYEDYNFAVQYEVTPNQSFELAYVGDQGHHMNTYVGTNAPSVILPPALNPQNYVPFPDFGRGSPYEMTGASTYYHSLQASFERRFSSGLSFLANYTFSKCRSDWRSPALSTIGGYRAPYLPGFGIQGDYSYCDADVPNLLHFSGLWDLPFGKGRRFLRKSRGGINQVVGGWRMNWILTMEDGMPFNVGCPISTTADYGCYALLVPGKNIYAGPHNVSQWINPAAFANPPVATSIGQTDFAPLGGTPTQAHGPGEHRLDFSLFKQFPVTESKRLEFRAEFFNLTNTPWFANPSFLDFTNPTLFGRITSLRDGANDPRETQFALKFYW
jgi:carboxypeptidase family protein/TonB-dependent receptor-like protein